MEFLITVLPTLFTFFIMACAYSAQYWAKKCYDELKAIREGLKRPE